MTKGLAVVFGGSGFIGQYVARQLVARGWRVRIACRRPHIVPHLKLSGGAGFVDLTQCNVRDSDSLSASLDGANAAIYLPGVLHERGNQTFENVHVLGAENVAKACAEKGIERFVHISAMGAATSGSSRYLQTKAEGERVVRAALPSARILRPSIVFGPEDGFFNRFASMARYTPALPSVNFGKTKFQPVYVNDLAKAAVNALEPEHAGKSFEVGGPSTYSLNEVYDLILKTIDKKRLKIPLPVMLMEPIGLFWGALYRYFPPFSWGLFGSPPFTGDQMRSLRQDNVASNSTDMTTLGVLDLKTVESVIPSYLWIYRQNGEFHQSAPGSTASQ